MSELRRILDRVDVARARAGSRAVSGSDLRNRRRLPSLLRPSRLPHQSRILQFCLAFLAQTSAQRGILWWAAKHRSAPQILRHRADVHSPVQQGFLYSHVGWIFVPRNDATDYAVVRDLARYRELMWLDRQPYLPAAAARTCDMADRRLARTGHRLLLEHGRGMARDVLHQLARPRRRSATLRDGRPVQKQLAAGVADHGRRLAQQSSRLPGVGAAGVPLVGVRSDLLCLARAVLARARVGPACSAEGA